MRSTIKKKFFPLAIILFLAIGFVPQPAKAQSGITIYVVPAITDNKILPTSSISSGYISSTISIAACPGEFEPASFVIRPSTDITSLQVEATDLVGSSSSIPASNVDIRVVKCWYQAGDGVNVGAEGEAPAVKTILLTPELLLKDDSLVKIENNANYLKINGEYVWISKDNSLSGVMEIPVADFPVQDSSTLQPVSIASGTNKQFWITVKVPDNAIAGIYQGKIKLGTIGEIQLQLQVLPFQLLQPYLTYAIYYGGGLSGDVPDGTISSATKSQQQLRAEMTDLLNHGIVAPAVEQYNADVLGRYMQIKNEELGYQPSYSISGQRYWTSSLKKSVDLLKSYGATDVYLYGLYDEPSSSQLSAWRDYIINSIHPAGAKAFCSLSSSFLTESQIEAQADILDVEVKNGEPNAALAAIYHSYGHKVFCYGNPQGVVEKPDTNRRNYGLLLWQRNYDGAMPFAYQWSFGNIWNDFDTSDYRDIAFAYPTVDGVIDTVQWEGFREGVDDVRYLTTLLKTIEDAKAQGKDTSAAEDWLAGLKTSNLAAQDPHAIRSNMIDYILSLVRSTSSVVRPGDVNGDGTINTADMTLVERIIVGLDVATPSADANQDGKINTADITKIERLIAGLD